MTGKRAPDQDRPTRLRVMAAGTAGLGVAVLVGTAVEWRYAAAAGWTLATAVFTSWTWRVIGRMSPQDTAAHATREDPARPLTDLITLLACVASLGGVVYLLAAGSGNGGAPEAVAAALGIASVVGAWLVVHTVYTTRYALLYYTDEPGGIDFNQADPPAYVDFAYLAFTLGMTYQVSDTDLQTRPIRATALRHALLSYLLGAVVLATVINLVAGLGSNGH
jgi:uncharacterized membrane protein